MSKSPARERFESRIPELVFKFERNLKFHTGKDYTEADVRSDFIDPLFEALGWDVRNTAGADRHARDVRREQSGLAGRPDYEFRLDNVTQFYVEAKAPHVPLDSVNVVLQAKKYAHTTGVDFVVITDFEEFRFFDANEKPNPRYINKGLVFEYRYKYFGTPHALDDLWQLSREAVHEGSLEKLRRPSRRAKLQRAPLDQRFLQELTGYREQLAKAVHKVAPERSAPDLNRLVQTFLDRLIFIRVGEDRRILPANGLANIARKWRDNGRVRPITADLFPLFAEVKEKFNGEIFRANEIQQLQWDSALIADVIEEGLSGYDFAQIPVELLGSIYERYLGKTIRLAGTQVKVEDKPEVRKAGGVYYTPKYIVDYIVAQTVGKLVEGKTPKQIAKLKILDPACGSGSFLLGAYQYLLDYHRRFYMEQARAKEAKSAHPRLLDAEQGGEYKLSLQEKAEILRNNLFGVDIDAQAVEITMMSLYIKMLEDERGAIAGTGVLPRLQDNIKCGNSLIGFDIYDEQSDVTPAEKARLNPFDWHSEREGFGAILKAGGFDAVIGNPPYVRIQVMKEWAPIEVEYYKEVYYAASAGNYDIYVVFVEKGLELLNKDGHLGFILPHKFFNSKYGVPLRSMISEGRHLSHIVHFGHHQIFEGATTYTALLFLDKRPRKQFDLIQVNDLTKWREGEEQERGKILASNVTSSEWNFTVGNGAELFDRLSKMPLKLGDVADIFVGLQTSADDIFILDFVSETKRSLRLRSKSLNEDWNFEKGILFPIVSGTDVTRYGDLPERQYIIFPYIVQNEQAELMPFADIANGYSQVAAYLAQNKQSLQQREKGKFRDEAWHRFGRNQNIGIQQRVKSVSHG